MRFSSSSLVSPTNRWRTYVALAKPDVTSLVVFTTAAGFSLGSRGLLDWVLMLNTLWATTLVAVGAAALNQYVERNMDAVMRRTASRPLPAGQLQPLEVLVFGVGAVFTGNVWLAIGVNRVSAFVALSTCILYLCAYTPLKTRTPLASAVGALPGALPPLIGWAAATGSISFQGWILFAIVFCWQFPHFMAIAWMYREDYARAGIKVLPVVDPKGDATFAQIIWTSALLVPVSLLPSLVGMVGMGYFFGALVLGLTQLQVGLWANRTRSNVRAKCLLHATVVHIPLLLGWMILDKLGR